MTFLVAAYLAFLVAIGTLPQATPELNTIARERAEYQIQCLCLDHQQGAVFVMLTDAGLSWTFASEVLAASTEPTPEGTGVGLASALWSSPPHAAILSDHRYTRSGTGIARGCNRTVVAVVLVEVSNHENLSTIG